MKSRVPESWPAHWGTVMYSDPEMLEKSVRWSNKIDKPTLQWVLYSILFAIGLVTSVAGLCIENFDHNGVRAEIKICLTVIGFCLLTTVLTWLGHTAWLGRYEKKYNSVVRLFAEDVFFIMQESGGRIEDNEALVKVLISCARKVLQAQDRIRDPRIMALQGELGNYIFMLLIQEETKIRKQFEELLSIASRMVEVPGKRELYGLAAASK